VGNDLYGNQYSFFLGQPLILIRSLFMTNTTTTKQQRLFNYLSRGKSVSADSAFSMFGIRNLRATVSDLRDALGAEITWYTGRHGETRYYLAS